MPIIVHFNFSILTHHNSYFGQPKQINNILTFDLFISFYFFLF